jgi:hypothetical protein
MVGKRPPSQETIIHYLASQGNVDSLGILLKSGHFQVRRLYVSFATVWIDAGIYVAIVTNPQSFFASLRET